MSRVRKILKAGGVTRTTKRVVLSLTITTMPAKPEYAVLKAPPDKANQHAHLNVDTGGLSDAEVLKLLEGALTQVKERMDVAEQAKRRTGDRALEAMQLVAASVAMAMASAR